MSTGPRPSGEIGREGVPAGFVHVPFTPELARAHTAALTSRDAGGVPTASAETDFPPSMPVEDAVRALTEALETLVGAARASRRMGSASTQA
ncbi:hypothetical protein [Trueperella abortisuis]|uniref:Pyrrolidone-carboxylate peptidase n=1 Tax=Trueperella abortisuis TaxID=445930 RepID=A0ABT9PHN3_9ACTO|nr:hypothetical protein [Trueperella abortisuis]MDP9831455.1 pyrrolidone-carboxylate peptidase [Trueperella abortisuis]